VTKAMKVVNLASHFEDSARRFPQRPAVVNPDGEEVRYGNLDDTAERIAAFLFAQGVGAGDRVALVMPKSAKTVAAMLGILKTGAAYVPIDWTAPSERIRLILRDCRIRMAFIDARVAASVAEAETGLEHAVIVGVANAGSGNVQLSSWEDVVSNNLDHAPRRTTGSDDLAYILYTSGSTGIPKGVMISHRNAMSFIDWCASVFHPTPEDRFSSHAPFHFDLSVLDLYLPLGHGASVHLIEDEVGKNPKALALFIANRKLTVWYSTPSILQLLVSFGHLERLDVSHLRVVLFAGEVFPIKHLRQLTKLWPKPEYYNLYGPTETNVCTYARIPLPIPEERTDPYPIGWACAHCKGAVLDDAGNLPVTRGAEGVLYIAGDSVFKGYWGRDQETSAAFRMRDGERWYSTGDVVREDPLHGFIYAGRRDRMVKRRGYRIELDDIECALYRHESIREAGVVAVEPEPGTVQIIAYIVSGTEPKPDIVQMKMFVAKELPAYMSPDVFMFLDSLPRTSTEKTDYQTLKRQFKGVRPKASEDQPTA
jgi:amino acid adenylation domain-containing protein